MKNPDALAKHALRERFRAARLALSDAEYEARSVAICARIGALPEIVAARTVHVYWPLVGRREVDTRPLIRALHEAGKAVVLPVVAGFDAPALRHLRYEGEERMRPNRWGIPEPVGTDEVTADALDAVVVPAFGAGRNGHRIGHGRGFYDAFLAGLGAFTVGAVFADCVVEAVPSEPHDVALACVVTEREAWHVPPASGPA